MTSKKFFFVMLGIVVLLLIIFAGGTYQANKLLKAESDNLLALKLESKVLDKQQADLQQAKRDIKEYAELDAISRLIVPQDKDQASTIAEIAALASKTGIRLGAIEFPRSELGQIAKGSKSKKKTAITDNSTTQLTELTDLKGVFAMNIDIANHKDIPVRYEQIVDFLSLLEGNRRTAQVTNISIQPDNDSPGRFNFSITLNTYVRPE